MNKQIALIGDFNGASLRSAILKGIIKKIDTSLEIYDANTYCPKNSIRQGSGIIYSVIPFWPGDAIFFCPIATEDYKGKWILMTMASGIVAVCPDNGCVTAVNNCYDVKAYHELPGIITEKDAANLVGLIASKQTDKYNIGVKITEKNLNLFSWSQPVIKKGSVECCLLMVMTNFGNLTVNVNFEQWEATGIENNDLVRLEVFHREKCLFNQVVPVYESFGFAKEGEPLVFNGSTGFLDFGLNRRNFVKTYLTDLLESSDDLSFYPVKITLVEKQGALKK